MNSILSALQRSAGQGYRSSPLGEPRRSSAGTPVLRSGSKESTPHHTLHSRFTGFTSGANSRPSIGSTRPPCLLPPPQRIVFSQCINVLSSQPGLAMVGVVYRSHCLRSSQARSPTVTVYQASRILDLYSCEYIMWKSPVQNSLPSQGPPNPQASSRRLAAAR